MATLFMRVGKYIKPRCPLVDKWIIKFCYKGILLSCKEKMKFIGKWGDLESIILSKVNQTQKEKSTFLPHIKILTCVCKCG